MSTENEKTVDVYKNKAKVYIETGIKFNKLYPNEAEAKSKKLKEFLKEYIGKLPKESQIFEIGSGEGINAEYLNQLGYEVTASDVAEDFIKSTEKRNIKTIKFNAITDEFSEKYYAILCWRVFVHFTKEDAKTVLEKVYNALENNGLFIFNAMNREIRDVDEEWVDFQNEFHMNANRYYKYFYEKELNDIINQIGYTIYHFHKEGGEDNNKWLVYVLKKM